MKDLVKLVDVLLVHGRIEDVFYARTTLPGPPAGIHVNGRSLWDITDLSDLPSAADHPALDRAIGLHRFPGRAARGGGGR